MADTWKDSNSHPQSRRDKRPSGRKNRRSRGSDRARKWGQEPFSQDAVESGNLDANEQIQQSVQLLPTFNNISSSLSHR